MAAIRFVFRRIVYIPQQSSTLSYKTRPVIIWNITEFRKLPESVRMDVFQILDQYQTPWNRAELWVIFSESDMASYEARWPISRDGRTALFDFIDAYAKSQKQHGL